MPAAHVAWCANRYRSYREETNTYRPYSGGEQTCVSPYADEQVGDRSGEAAIQSASISGIASGLSASHISDCQSRYRSYRVSDNSYQPYGGGPRRQC
ncbi:BA14K family protein [Georhizobium profundi]|uniref:Lectin-like protein BA14k n=1 Tax=Georhizobium profundi TaxID=2341112 RepID=A0A3S9BAC4_9HYPH|nr:BA14K family protein [Georhizobium profundi]